MNLFRWYSNREVFFKRFGLWAGYRISTAIFPKHAQIKEVSVYIPEYNRRILLRTNTSDISTFTKVLLDEEYRFRINFEPVFILDAGANIGLSALFFANKFPKAKIVTIEPEKSNLELLNKNLRGLNYSSREGALWNKNTALIIKDTSRNVSGFQVMESDDKEGISAFTVQDIMSAMETVELDILKVDIEGAEVEVFTDNFHSWLPRTKVLIIETHDRFRPGCTEVLLKALCNYNFERAEKGENLFFVNKDYNVEIEL